MSVSLGISPRPAGDVDAVAFGECSLDFVAVLDPNRARGSKHSLSSFSVLPGGQMSTAAAGLQRLGCSARFVGPLGDDLFGSLTRAALERTGMDVHPIQRDRCASRVAIVMVGPNGEREILEHRDARLTLTADEVPLASLLAGRVLLVDATNPAAATRAAAAARQAGVPTVVDVDRVSPEADNLLGHIDVIIVPEPFMAERMGTSDLHRGLEAMTEAYPAAALVVVTRGEQGSAARRAGHVVTAPAFRVDAVDTTGAGDAFRSGFVARWLERGATADLADVLRFANATAALNCRQLGAQSSLPTRAEVLAFLNGGAPWAV
jgi:sugar/nucleoside kinase (ribokinase family)